MHGVGGCFGVLAVGIFADGKYGAGWNVLDRQWTKDNGVTGIVGGEFGQFFAQVIGAAVIATVIFGIAFAFFKICAAVMGGIRSSAEDEIAGLDMGEMGVLAYPEFDTATTKAAPDPVLSGR